MKTWLIFWTIVASTLIVLTLLVAGWLDWLGNPLWVTAAATLLLAAGVAVALIGLGDARRTRHAQIVTDLSARWDSRSSVESRRIFLLQGQPEVSALFQRLYSPPPSRTLEEFDADLRLQGKLLVWPNLLETIGVLHKTGIVSTDVVYRMWGAGVFYWWQSWKPIAEALLAADESQPALFRHFRKLSDDMESHAAELGEPFPD
jgi:hypothetical protein